MHRVEIPSDYGNAEIISITFYKDSHEVRFWHMDWTPEYKESVSQHALQLQSEILSTGALGACELAISPTDRNKEKYYLRLQMTDPRQARQILESLQKRFDFNADQMEILETFFVGNDFPLNRGTHPCYFIGTVSTNREIHEVRFFFQAHNDRFRSKEQSKAFLDYLSSFAWDFNTQFVTELVDQNLILLDGFALDFFDDGKISPKYLFVPAQEKTGELLAQLEASGYEIPVDWTEIAEKGLNLFCFQTALDRRGNPRINVYLRPQSYRNPPLYSIPENIVLRDIGSIYFLIDICRKDYYDVKNLDQINQVGAQIIRIIQENRYISLEGICQQLFKIFEAQQDSELQTVIREDTAQFINDLVSKGMVNQHDG